jgi:hypothetical protein
MKSPLLLPAWRALVLGLAAALAGAAVWAQGVVIVVPPTAPAPGTDYRAGSVSSEGPDVDPSNTAGVSPMTPAGVPPPAAVDTLGSDAGAPTPVGHPAPMGGAGPEASGPQAAETDAPVTAPPRTRAGHAARGQGTGPDGTANPGGHGVVIISPRH